MLSTEIDSIMYLQLLADFIRNQVMLKGTKLGCEEGGCGACTVTLTNNNGIVSVNSCLRLLCLNDGMSITTVEGIGSVCTGLSEEQKRLVANNGSQCGYCTPGWVTNMHALRESASLTGQDLSAKEIQAYFDGNICRCTGYKPILQAFSSFAHENQADNHRSCVTCPNANSSKCDTSCLSHDLEDGYKAQAEKAVSVGSKSKPLGRSKDLFMVKSFQARPLMFYNASTNTHWLRPLTLDELCHALQDYAGQAVQLVGGNTSIGVSKYFNGSGPYYHADPVNVYIDINSIPDLVSSSFNQSTGELTVGAGVTISSTIALLRQYGKFITTKDWNDVIEHKSTFDVVAHHLLKIANTQVRNAGSLAGNLCLFLRYTSFPSDLVLSLTMANAKLNICHATDGSSSTITMEQFLSLDYDSFVAAGSFIVSIVIAESNYSSTASSTNASYTSSESFKVSQREHNAHAHVNAGFQYQIVPSNPPVILSARVVFGGVSAKTFIASKTQAVFQNSRVTSSVLSRALLALQADLAAVGVSTAYGDQKFRESVMMSCLYRSLLRCFRFTDLPSNLSSAVLPWIKPESRGTEVFIPSSGKFDPVGKPVRKLEAPIQATGEAVYPSDEQISAQTLHAAMVFTTQCSTKLLAIDSSAALAVSGVVAVYTAADIPGTNSIGKDLYLLNPIGEEVKAIGLPYAIVVASSESVANDAAALVSASYADPQANLVTNIVDAIQQKSFYPLPNHIPSLTYIKVGDPVKALEACEHRVHGSILAGGQSHIYMETQTAIAKIVDGDNIDIVCGTQHAAGYQSFVAATLGLQSSKVTVHHTRSGGAFGGKLTRGIATASAAALCAMKLGRSVRIFNNRTSDMILTGGRESFAFDYEVGYTSSGQITAIKINFYIDAGIAYEDTIGGMYMGMNWADNAYYFPNYIAEATLVYTNTSARTSMRAPGVVQACLATEMIVERVAHETSLSTTQVQQLNFIQDGQATISGQVVSNSTLTTVWDTLYSRSRYADRYSRISAYNASSLWRKRGISICPVKYGIGWSGYNAGVNISINLADGSVMVTHTGAEIGQGINTKVAQTVAQELDIPLSLVRITSSSTDKIANGGYTGGSGTSEVTCQAVINACAVLNERFAPYRDSSATSSSIDNARTKEWTKFLSKLPSDVSVNAEGWYSPTANPSGGPFQYYVYAACVTEVALDVLSGQVHVLASEIVYDCGQSLNPAVDIGQIEGGFVLGLGYFLSEKVYYAADGTLETVGTWEYKPPLGSDIPSIFNITFLKDVYNAEGIMGSKAVGEPPNIIANSIFFATKMAVASARADAGETGYFNMEVPMTIDVRQQASLVKPSRFVLPS
jgi:xanthine dehydrogenase/oxidase